MEILKELHVAHSVIGLYCDNDGLSVSSSGIDLHFFDHQYNKLYTQHIEDSKELHQFSKAISHSKNQLCLPTLYGSRTRLYNYKLALMAEEERIRLDDEIEVSTFSDNAKLLFIGDIAGRCKIFHNQELITTLKPKPDYINIIRCSSDNRYLLYSAFNKSTTIYDIKRSKYHVTFLCDDVIADALFIDTNHLLLALQNGALILYDIQKKEKIFHKNVLNYWPTKLLRLNDQFILIATRDVTLYFFNLNTHEVSFHYRLPYKGLCSVARHKNRIYFGFINGTIQIIDMNFQLDAFEIALKVNNVAQIQDITKKNIFLKTHPEYSNVIDFSFDNDLQTAIKEISHSHSEIAKKIMDPHKENERYKEFEFYLKYTSEIVKFYSFLEQRDLTNAFIMVSDLDFLKKTQAYAQLEIIWNNTFKKAKTLLQSDPIGNYKKAENIIRPFLTITEKRKLISNLFNNIDIFSKADDTIKNRDFKKYFAYVKKYDFLIGTDIYEKMLLIGQKLRDDMLEYENLIRYHHAIQCAMDLKPFFMFQNDITKMATRIKIKKQFDHYISTKEYNKAFIMMDTYDFVQALPKAIRLESKLQADIEKAYTISEKPKEVLEVLALYLSFDSCKELIANTLEQKYIKEMYKYSDKVIIHWEQVFIRFLSIYGESSELSKFAILSGKEKTLQQAMEHYQFIGAKKAKLPLTILIKK